MEKFNYDGVNTKMTALNKTFTDLVQLLDKIDIELNDNVNIGDEAAVHGNAAKNLLDSWNACSSTFVNFKTVFDNLYNLVLTVGNNNAKFEEEATKMFYSESK